MSMPTRIRLVAGIFFLGAAVAFFSMMRIAGWERVDGGSRIIAPGGGGGYVKPEILPLLGQYGGIAVGLGIALLVAAQIYAVRQRRAAAEGRVFPAAAKVGPVKTVLLVIVAITLGIGITFGWRWYDYVANSKSPYDEVGIVINSRLPASLNAWGCGRLKERFGRQVPPLGCSDASGRAWR